MYLYCVYPAISKCPKQLAYCLKIGETIVVIIIFNGVLLTSALILLPSITVALH